ncbi:hypothetical protein ACFL0F_02270 [Patescibacteria group bacterium]
MKRNLRDKAISLRKKGYTYSEILGEVPVAKSTLSLWLRSVNLSKKQYQRITVKKLAAAHRGGEARKRNRILVTNKIKTEAMNEIGTIDNKDLWLMGIMLHWAEGSKNSEYRPSVGVIFSNSDSLMIKIYIKWLKECIMILNRDIYFDLFVHKTKQSKISGYIKHWANITGFPESKFDKIYLKSNKIKSNRKNRGKYYNGLLRVRVKRSTNLNRRIEGWIQGVCKGCGVV